MAWRYTAAGKEIDRPSRNGICVDGPLTVEDIRKIIEALLDEMVDMAGEPRS